MDTRPNFLEIETKWQQHWISSNIYSSHKNSKPKFSMVLPPPNVTGVLHIGHALNTTFQDVLARSKRLQGFNVCWVPGTDHAGIATQMKVESKLREIGKNKKDMLREEFINEIWNWKEEHGKKITQQLKRLGCSLDWTREQFTLDEKFSDHVKSTFFSLYSNNIIYQSEYIINWDPVLQTAISDEEVNTTEVTGKLYWIKYYSESNSNDYILIATSRPETLFGDVAIGYYPDDTRYSKLTSKYLVPIINKPINLIADNNVDKDFGSGLVKITPSHDKFDFDFGMKHNLPQISIINKEGKIYNTNTKYDGLKTNQARTQIVNDLTESENIEKIQEYKSVKKTCYRSGAVIEPLITTQWFVDLPKLGHFAKEQVDSGYVELYPKNQLNTFNHWINTLKPWCISRQLVWGHRIPVWNCTNCKNQMCCIDVPKVCNKCNMFSLIQDPDVLDTWFSSWLWSYGVFSEKELDYYYPLDTLITGSDILFFWVIKMMMASGFNLNKIPFHKVYLHGIVRDNYGKKMSKALGNVINPLSLIDKVGVDAFRMSLCMSASYSQDIMLDEKLLKIGKTFCTKLWNVVRFFIIGNLNHTNISDDISKIDNFTSDEMYIIENLKLSKITLITHLDNFEFCKGARLVYKFIWDDFANNYLEHSKLNENENTKIILKYLITESLILAHPFIRLLLIKFKISLT